MDEAKLEKAKFNYSRIIANRFIGLRTFAKTIALFAQIGFRNLPPIHIKSHEFLSEIVKRSDKEIGSIMRNFQNQIKLLWN